jgi:hypothetical protein
MEENDEYTIVDATDTLNLKARVSKLLKDGWKCQGGPYQSAATPNRAAEWHQAMTRSSSAANLKEPKR